MASVEQCWDLPPVGEALEVAPSSVWCQRWRAGHHSWRHRSDGGFDAARFEIRPLDELNAKRYVMTNHYSGSYPAAARRYGLYGPRVGEPGSRLVGVAVFGIPVRAAVLTNTFPALQPYVESLELSRFVLDEDVPANGESWFLARCFAELVAVGVHGVVSFADPVPRAAADGTVVAPGHVGVIYQAVNGRYTGRGTPRTLTVLPDGTVLNQRSAQKVRRSERGHGHVEDRLVRLGARTRKSSADPAAWLRSELVRLGATQLRHRGNHRYAFPLGRNRRQRESVLVSAAGGRYPKRVDVASWQ